MLHHNLGYRHVGLFSIVMIALSLAVLPSSLAAPLGDPQCFPGVPNINNCLNGRFDDYWHLNGGLQVFGYPITDEHAEINLDKLQPFTTQWVERNRLERHPENAPPYDVLLGRLGDELLRRNGRDWRDESFSADNPLGGSCQHFDQTNRNVCGPFLDYWKNHGLNDPALDAFNRSLQLFGLPLTNIKTETNSSGNTVLTQWFERARFEYYPNNSAPYKVLLGLLGNEARAGCTGDQGPSVQIFNASLTAEPQIATRLGCPTTYQSSYSPLTRGVGAEQPFQHGKMLYYSGNQTIYVLLPNQNAANGNLLGSGRWLQFYDDYHEGEAETPLSPPPGLLAPQRGFGKVWRANSQVASNLGWATAPEIGYTGMYKAFQNGFTHSNIDDATPNRNPNTVSVPTIYVFFRDGTYLALKTP